MYIYICRTNPVLNFSQCTQPLMVRPDGASLLLGTRDSVPMDVVPRCPRVLKVLPTMSECPNSRIPSYPTLLEALATPWDSVEQRPWGHCPLSQGAKLHRLDRPLTL